ncbi:hypothetical protein QAD02_010912 [Eretmocerus hayati]|uniref:Uncharacterized protein n=1 Tax=Eretmocerus hayati TaxID=131215 RepID=A0ACC2NVF3_9HYME|nr:hypothetical protein QAD02_010912 [Eretmocerus hayati]
MHMRNAQYTVSDRSGNMDLGTIFLSVVLVTIVNSTPSQDSNPMAYIVDYMKENLSTYQVTVMAKSINALGPFSSSIVKIMIDEFSSVVVDSSVMDTIPTNRSYGNLWDRTSDQSKLKIGIIELQQGSDTLNELWEMLDFFIKYSEFVRGKCIIFLINGQGLDLESFLKFAWTKDFLDLTIVEWIGETSKKSLTSSKSTSYEIFIHVLNPFEKKYVKEVFTNNTDVLPDKLKNSHGHSLKTLIMGDGWQDRYHQDKSGPKEIDEIDGPDVHRIKLLSEALNFTAKPKLLDYAELKSCGRNGNDSCYSTIDLTPDIFKFKPDRSIRSAMEYKSLIRYNSFTNIYMPMLGKYRLYLVQQRVTENHHSSSFFISCGALVMVLMTFLSFSRILKLDNKIWSIPKVAQILLGGSIAHQKDMNLKEKIILVTAYFTSIILMTIISDELLKMDLSKRGVLRFKTLQELADSSVKIRISNSTKNLLSNWGHYRPILQKIANQSIALKADKLGPNGTPLDKDDTSITGGLVDYTSLEMYPSVASIDEKWFYTVIEEDVWSSAYFMRVRKNFPYKDRFSRVIPKLRETGLMVIYYRRWVEDTVRHVGVKQSTSALFHLHHNNENDIDIEIALEVKLMLIISMGYCIACINLAYEIVTGRLKTRQRPVKISSMKN